MTESRLVPTECFDERNARYILSSVQIFVGGQLLTLPHSFLPQPAFVVQRRPRVRRGPGPGLNGRMVQNAQSVINFSSWIHWLTKAVGTLDGL